MNRRTFLRLSTITAGSALALSTASRAHGAVVPERDGPELRTVTYNVLACRGYPDTRQNREVLQAAKDQIPRRIALELALVAPDIVTFQEGPAEAVVAEIADHLAMNYVFLPGGWPGDDSYPGGFPGAVLSRFPIRSYTNCPIAGGAPRPDDLFTRHWGMATIDVDGTPLPIYSAHLHPSKAETRENEVTEVLRVMQPDQAAGRSFLFQGDLNHRPDSAEYTRWKEAGLVDAFATAGEGWDASFPATTPRSRIDYLWAHGPLAKQLKSARHLYRGAFRTNPDDPFSFALSDHVPVLAVFDRTGVF